MGLRFRRSTHLGPLRLNLSGSGVGWSVGAKGARFGVGPTGIQRTTLSLPGTGVSYVTTSSNRRQHVGAVPSHVGGWIAVVLCVLSIHGCAACVALGHVLR